jgi:molecular chaperone GrpE (heat shock protein)
VPATRPDRTAERDALARAVAELVPQLPDALAWQATNALASGGVRPVVPDGRPLDPAAHHVVGTEASPDPARADTIARTVRPGYAAEDGRLLVHPKVVVYRPDGAS